MRFTKPKITSAMLAIVLTLSLQPAYAADAYKIDQQMNPGLMALDLVDSFSSTGEGASFMVANTPRPGENMPDEHLCQGFGPAPCDYSNGTTLWASLLAPACTNDSQSNCIESLSVYKDGEPATPAKFVRQSEGDTIQADPSHNLTQGSTKSLWSAFQPNSGGTADYAAFVQLTVYLDQNKQVHVANMSASVMPIKLVSGNYQATRYLQGKTPEGREQVSGTGAPSDCAFVELNTCGRLQDFAPQTKVKLAVRVENTIGGWFKGRMKAPTIDVKGISPKANLITFDAEPVIVPQFFARFDVGGSDPGVAKWLSTLNFKPQNGGGQNVLTGAPGSFELVDNFRKATNDTSAGVNTLWTASAVQGSGNPCLADHSKVLGIVTTNSMVYQGDAPQFVDGGLNYKVGGLHYLPDGKTAVEGTYDLVMRSETARCLYGFTKAPISASIAVTSGDGESKVATTLMSEKDGWLKLAAYGFTFSENRIVAKISQKPEAVAVTVKKATITCTKGKQVKKVTAIAPKCPAGYKKKL
jgi:hypothetical protein